MRIFNTYFIFLLFILVGISNADEFYFRFQISNKSDLDQLTRIISIDNVKGDTVFAYANDESWEQFKQLNYAYELLPHPGSRFEHKMSNLPMEIRDWDTYPTYDGYVQMMQQYAANYPTICRLDTFGYSVQGRLLLALVISDSVKTEEAEPEFLYTSTMHGDETVGYILLLRLADYLLTHYGDLSTPEGRRVTNLVDNLEIWLNPLFNPDGTYHGGNNTVNGARRYNANGEDLNRNFPDRINDPYNTPAGRESETQAMMALAAQQNFILSTNFHGGSQVVNYAWDNGAPSGSYSACPDDAWFINLSRAYATPNPDLLYGGFPNGITNGCAWYSIYGGRQDWIYYFEGGRETTIELWNDKNPPGSVLPQRWTNNKESLLAYMEKTFRGIRGTITDASTGSPLFAQIDVTGYQDVPVYSDPDVGDFYRLLLPGTYSLVVSAQHFYPDTMQNVTVVDSPMIDLQIALQPKPKGYVYGRAHLTDTTYAGDIEVSIEDNTVLTNSNGYFTLPAIFSGDLEIRFSKTGYSQSVLQVHLNPNDSLWVETTLYPSSGAVLLIDDDSGDRKAPVGDLSKSELMGFISKYRGGSATFFNTVMTAAGYQVTVENSGQTDPSTWANYGLLIWSSGQNTGPVANSTLRNTLINYVNAGGKLIIEGGEIGYDHQNTNFAQTVLGISDWQTDNAGNLIVESPGHPLTQNLPANLNLNYTGYGDQDAVVPRSGVSLIISNQNRPNTGGLLLNGDVVYMAFAITALNANDAEQLTRNAVSYQLPHQASQKDLAIYELPTFPQGNMYPADSLVSVTMDIKNYGEQTQLAGIPVSLTVENEFRSETFDAFTQDSIVPGGLITIDLGSWIVPDTVSEWTAIGQVDFPGDEVPSNNREESRFQSYSSEMVFVEDFESGLNNWSVQTSDTSHLENSWHTASWPVMGGWHSAAVFPDQTGKLQEEWLISPKLTNPAKLYFCWDFGHEPILKDTLNVLVSTSDSLPESFTDTLLVLKDGQNYPANGFSQMQIIDLSAYQTTNPYIAFVYEGSDGYYWAIDNIIVEGSPPVYLKENSDLPTTFSLYQNYPNPFNPGTTISFDLPFRSYVNLKIYNILGEEVKTLVKRNLGAGRHNLYWDASNFASGIYFYRVEIRTSDERNRVFTDSKKLILLK